MDSFGIGRYYWRVRAFDEDALAGPWSVVGSFAVVPVSQDAIPGRIRLAIEPAGDIFIDGRLQDRNRRTADLSLNPGDYLIRVDNAGSLQKSISKNITVESGESREYSFNFTFEDEPPEVDYGRVSVGSRPVLGAVVYIDGRKQERQTPNTFRLEAGTHEIRAVLSLDGREKTLTETIPVVKDSTSKIIFDFER